MSGDNKNQSKMIVARGLQARMKVCTASRAFSLACGVDAARSEGDLGVQVVSCHLKEAKFFANSRVASLMDGKQETCECHSGHGH